MKELHLTHCVLAVAAAAAVAITLGVSAGTPALLAIALACPVMMLVMMRTMMGADNAPGQPDTSHDRPEGATSTDRTATQGPQ